MPHTKHWIHNDNNKVLLPWLEDQLKKVSSIYQAHGDYRRWQQSLKSLSKYKTTTAILSQATPQIGQSTDQHEEIKTHLMGLSPWRKGPFNVFGTKIDSEWKSDKKWERISGKITSLKGKHVLDIGCGNGYYMLRMLGEGAEWVLGIDPSILVTLQFKALTQCLSVPLKANILPIGIDQLPDRLTYFDTVFSMGVFYHRRSPFDHLYKLYSCLRPGGELVLETLIIEDDNQQLLVPSSRYAKMRNVWFIPTVDTLQAWLSRCGFINIKLIDISATTTKEQRSTEWMKFESLPDFLDPNDSTKTIEGYPAPVRAVLCADRPEY